jgi:hypothetical protein
MLGPYFRFLLDDDLEDPDDIMCNFIPMIKEYLTCKLRLLYTWDEFLPFSFYSKW